jgi:hypothetical protein
MSSRRFAALAFGTVVFAVAWALAAEDSSGVGPRRSNTRTQSQRNDIYNTAGSNTYAQRGSSVSTGASATGAGGMSGSAPRIHGIQIAPAGMSILGANPQTFGSPGPSVTENAGSLGASRSNTRTQSDRNLSVNTAYSDTYGVRDNRVNAAEAGVAGAGGVGAAGYNAAGYNTEYMLGNGTVVPNMFTYLPGVGYYSNYIASPEMVGGGGTAGMAAPGVGGPTAGEAGGGVGAAGAGIGAAGGVGGAAGLGGAPVGGGGNVAAPPGGSFSPPAIGYRVLPEATPGPTREAMASNPNWPPRPTNYMRSIPLEPSQPLAVAPRTNAAVSPVAPAAQPTSGRVNQRAISAAPAVPTVVDNSLLGHTGGRFARDSSGRYGLPSIADDSTIAQQAAQPSAPARRSAITRGVAER